MMQTAVPGLSFDEASHTYRHQGVEVPSVTQVLRPVMDLSHVPPEVLASASAFGLAVHKACELDDLDQLDEESLADELVPYLSAWRKFCRDYDAEWHGIEERVYHPQLRYAGTLDRRGLVRVDPSRAYRNPAIVDIKSGTQLYPAVGPQLAAYHRALDESSVTTKRLAVQLKPDGTYVAKWHDDATDFALFCSLLTLRNWCAKHQLTPNFQQERS
jgi:hypothetical protein